MRNILVAVTLLQLTFSGCGISVLGRIPKKPLIPIEDLKGKIVFSSDQEKTSTDRVWAFGIYVVNANGTGLQKLSPPLAEQYLINNDRWSVKEDCPVWSPSGDKILFTHQRDQKAELWLMKDDGTERRVFVSSTLDSTIGSCFGIDWSPNGENIAVHAASLVKEWVPSIAIIKNIRTTPKIERIYIGNSYGPKWSLDGEKIMFWGFGKWKEKPGDSDHEIFIMNKDGTNLINVTNNPARDADPDWSPDGNKIAFISSRDGKSNHLYIMDADGNNVIKLTSGNFICSSPVWSPDGRFILYCRSNKSPFYGYELWVTTSDGYMERQLTKSVRFKYGWSTDKHPDWK